MGLKINETKGLPIAATNNDMKMVDYLVNHGASNFNETLKHLCIRDGNIDMVKYIINLGAKNYEESMKYVRNDNKELLELLKNYPR